MFLRHRMLSLNAAVLVNYIKHRIHSNFTLEVKKNEIEFKVIPLFKTYNNKTPA